MALKTKFKQTKLLCLIKLFDLFVKGKLKLLSKVYIGGFKNLSHFERISAIRHLNEANRKCLELENGPARHAM